MDRETLIKLARTMPVSTAPSAPTLSSPVVPGKNVTNQPKVAGLAGHLRSNEDADVPKKKVDTIDHSFAEASPDIHAETDSEKMGAAVRPQIPGYRQMPMAGRQAAMNQFGLAAVPQGMPGQNVAATPAFAPNAAAASAGMKGKMFDWGNMESSGLQLDQPMKRAYDQGVKAAMEKFGGMWGSIGNAVGKGLQFGGKMLGTIPAGITNAAGAVMGGIGGGMQALANGEGWKGMALRGGVGAASSGMGIIGGTAVNMGANAAIDKMNLGHPAPAM